MGTILFLFSIVFNTKTALTAYTVYIYVHTERLICGKDNWEGGFIPFETLTRPATTSGR